MSNEKGKTSMIENGSWDGLPQDICEVICNKLPLYSDQIYFRAVCKTWRIPSANLRPCLKYRPWLINVSNTSRDVTSFDSCAQKVYKFSNSLHQFYLENVNPIEGRYYFTFYASKNGWLLLGLGPGSKKGCLVLYNPFSDDIILLPKLLVEHVAATFTTDPKSPDCEVLVLCNCRPNDAPNVNKQYVARYCITRDKEWNMKNIGITPDLLLYIGKLHYMKGKLYCLSEKGILKSYDMKEDYVELLSQEFPIDYPFRFWLTEHEDNLILVCKYKRSTDQPWIIMRFDWSVKGWVFEKVLRNAAIFVSWNYALVAPLLDGNDDDCHVCYLEDCKLVESYSMMEMKRKSLNHYWAMNTNKTVGFIEPPLVSK